MEGYNRDVDNACSVGFVQVVECLQQTSEKEEVTVMRASLTCLAVLFRFYSRFHSSAGTE